VTSFGGFYSLYVVKCVVLVLYESSSRLSLSVIIMRSLNGFTSLAGDVSKLFPFIPLLSFLIFTFNSSIQMLQFCHLLFLICLLILQL